MDIKIACCLCVRDCYNYLQKIFQNLDLLSKEFVNFYVIFVYDNCQDDSSILLEEYKQKSPFKVFIVNNIGNNDPNRTARIANARNKCLDVIYNLIRDLDFHIMIDADDVNEKKWNINLIKQYLLENTWDSLSFNRRKYYDIWALLYDKYKYHCWGYDLNDSIMIRDHMKKEITNILKNLNTDLFECYSAFNGFAIYRTPIFSDLTYDGFFKSIREYITDKEMLETVEHLSNKLDIKLKPAENLLTIQPGYPVQCEHLTFHLSAIKKKNARIRISKHFIDSEDI